MLPLPSPKVSCQEGDPNSPAGAFSLSHTRLKQKGPRGTAGQTDRATLHRRGKRDPALFATWVPGCHTNLLFAFFY